MEIKISDLMDYLQDDTVSFEVKDIASADRIKEDTMKKIDDRNNRNGVTKKVRKLSSMVAVAAVMLVLLTGAAFAVVGFTVYENPAAMLRAFFGESYEDHNDGRVEYDEDGKLTVNVPGWDRIPVDETLADGLISQYISAETETISWDGYTLTIEANLCDSRTESGLLYYSIENPDGITGYQVRDKGSILFHHESISFYPSLGNSWGGAKYIDEARSTDTKIYICEYYIGFMGLSDDLGDLELRVLSSADNEVLGSTKLNYTNESNISGLTLADGNVLISPIGIRIYNAGLGFALVNDIHSIILRYHDGTEYVLLDESAFIDNSAYGLLDSVSTPSRITYLFNRLVDINSLTEIVLNDITIPVK